MLFSHLMFDLFKHGAESPCSFSFLGAETETSHPCQSPAFTPIPLQLKWNLIQLLPLLSNFSCVSYFIFNRWDKSYEDEVFSYLLIFFSLLFLSALDFWKWLMLTLVLPSLQFLTEVMNSSSESVLDANGNRYFVILAFHLEKMHWSASEKVL